MFVKVKNLSFKYKNTREYTIKNFNIEIEKGDILAILGQSGSGKSTLLRLIAGLETPNSGIIRIDGKIVADEKTFIVPEKRDIGMVFQDYALFPHMIVEKNIGFGLKKVSKDKIKERVKEMIELVNLKGYEKRYPYELSGGQQQRVAIARALAPKPALLLLDEPFSNLDTQLKEKIRDEIKSIIKSAGTTSIFVTHDKEDVAHIADKVIIIEEGKIIKKGKAEEIILNNIV
jgi:iron(III) transport system ATP-binding protein